MQGQAFTSRTKQLFSSMLHRMTIEDRLCNSQFHVLTSLDLYIQMLPHVMCQPFSLAIQSALELPSHRPCR